MDVRLRRATKKDTDFARRTHHDAFRDVVVRQFGRFDEQHQDAFFDAEWDPKTYEIVVVDDEPAGYAQIEDADDAIRVRQIVIAPAYQNRGAGRDVMSDVIERART